MTTSRRDFIKMIGVSVSALFLSRCRFLVGPTCYAPMPPSSTPTVPASARERLRMCWQRFDALAQTAVRESKAGDYENSFGQQLMDEHRAALDALVAEGELTATVAELVQEGYEAAVFHVWRSNIPVTCYEPRIVDYEMPSAAILVRQAQALEQAAAAGTIDPATIERARAALEHDMAFYALTEEEVNQLYERLLAEWQSQQEQPPAFEAMEFEITPEAQAAARFIIALLTTP